MTKTHQNRTNQPPPPTETTAPPPVRQPRAITSNLHHLNTEIADWKSATGGSFTDILAGWSIPQYLITARDELDALENNGARLRLLRRMVRDSATIQRGSYWTLRLQLDHERLALEHEKHKLAQELASQKPKKRRDVTQPLTDEERLAIIDKVDEVMGLKR